MAGERKAVRVAVIQMAMEDDREANLRRARGFVNEAAAAGAAVAVLPELFADRYFPQRMVQERYDLAGPVPGPLTERIASWAGSSGLTLVAGVYERAAEGLLFNTSLVFSPSGEIEGRYRKVHIPHGPGYEEKFYFAPGDRGFRVVDAAAVRLGLAICWDQWFPETGRSLGLQGAELVTFPTAIGSEPTDPGFSSAEAWRTACRAQAIFNQVFVAAVNRTGEEELLRFYGGSFVCDPSGRVLVEAGPDDEGVFIADCDLGLIRRARELFQFYRDRRPDAYGAIGGLSG
jgi:N-carbamoylputrescine amidase